MEFKAAVRQAINPTGTLVLMHGLGADEQDMLGLAEELDPRWQVVCLRAPFAYGPGFAWFDVGWTESGIQIDKHQFWTSVSAVAEVLPQIGGNLVVGGFSQGAMMTVGLMARYPATLSHAVLLSGRGVEEAPTRFAGRVFQGHGRHDEVIRFQEGLDLRDSLASLGPRLAFFEYEMGHGICAEEATHLNEWLGSLAFAAEDAP